MASRRPWLWKSVCVFMVGVFVSALLIRGVEGFLKPSGAPLVSRKILFSVTTEHPPNDLDRILHASNLQTPIISPPWNLDVSTAPPPKEDETLSPVPLRKQQNRYAPSPEVIPEGNARHPPAGLPHMAEVLSPPKQAVIPSMQPTAPPNPFGQMPNGATSPSIHSSGPSTVNHADHDLPPSHMIYPPAHTVDEVPNPYFHGKVPSASPSLPVQPLTSPPATPITPHTHQSSPPLPVQPPTTLPSIDVGSPSITQVSPHAENYQPVPPTSMNPPTSQHNDGIPVAAPPDKSSSQNNSPPKAIPPTFSTSPTSRDQDGTPVATPLDKSSSKNNSLPKVVPPTSITSPINQDNDGIPASAPPDKLSNQNNSPPKAIPPPSISPPPTSWDKDGVPVAAPPYKLSSRNNSLPKAVPPPSISPLASRHKDGVSLAAPPDKSSSQNSSLPKGVPLPSISPPSSQDKDSVPVAAPPNKLSSQNSSRPKGARDADRSFPPKRITPPPIDSGRYKFPNAAPPAKPAIPLSPPQRGHSHLNAPAVSPSSITSPAIHGTRYGMPAAAPLKESSTNLSPSNDSHVGGSAVSPPPANSLVDHGISYGIPAVAPPKEKHNHLRPVYHSHIKSPAVPPASTNSPANHRKAHGSPAVAPSMETHHLLPVNNSRVKRHAAAPESKSSPINPGKANGSPVAAPSKGMPHHSFPVNNSRAKVPAVSPAKNAPVVHHQKHGTPVAAPPKEEPSHLPPANNIHHKGSFPAISPAPHKAENSSRTIHAPFSSPRHHSGKTHHSSAPAPVPVRSLPLPNGKGNPAYAPHHRHHLHHSPSYPPALSHAPAVFPKHRRKRATSPYAQGPVLPPVYPPHSRPFRKPKPPAPEPFRALPPPPPNLYCTPLSCQDPLTNSPPGTPCQCVLPIKVELRLSIALYSFFTLVSELAQEIASGVSMKQVQVRIMGANAATEEPEKTVVLIDLVPLGDKFDNTTAFLVFEKFWHKQVFINHVYFGNYDVLYVTYPGLPPPPPTAPGDLNNGASNLNTAGSLHPLAVDVRKHNKKKSAGMIAVIVLSSVFAFALCVGAALVIFLKLRDCNLLPEVSPTLSKAADAGSGAMAIGSRLCSRPTSASASFSSSLAPYKGTAKTFSLFEMERATNRFDDSRIIGEGGFGRVYEGILEDGKQVAVKVLKRDDQQGSREFLAEVELLSRLHHRNLVKLIGICTEEHIRCLVYELIPNGSVESHLHGTDKEAAPLDWDARLKIALGAARALAYLHEDSSPRVIHRDFKLSNILLEQDFTPKVSDFGLARAALGEGNEHISTRVMGTFGYVAPEYAMTGHLLVKSDVYSYGVVLLELLTGRKPVDMLRPPGQENLVTWAHPLLTSKDGLETIIDPSLGNYIPFDSLAKVAAIASMCVQPEVDQRPFMGEVVQALQLVCNANNEFEGSGSCSQEELHIQDTEVRTSTSLDMEVDRVLSASDLFSASARLTMDASGSFRRYSSSGPLRIGRSGQFWRRERGLSTGSSSEHAVAQRLGMSSDGGDRYLWS